MTVSRCYESLWLQALVFSTGQGAQQEGTGRSRVTWLDRNDVARPKPSSLCPSARAISPHSTPPSCFAALLRFHSVQPRAELLFAQYPW